MCPARVYGPADLRSGLRDHAVWRHSIDGLRQNLSELLSQLGHGQAGFRSELLDEVRPKHLMDLICGNRLVGTRTDPGSHRGPEALAFELLDYALHAPVFLQHIRHEGTNDTTHYSVK
jgi:hypothetical protein